MCGVLGGINTDFDEPCLRRLRHRGPNQSSLVSEEVPGHGTVTLGQTRLNIVDRHDVDLPIRIGHTTILFNGEIYNHPELRSDLEGLGWAFETKTDTEVALAAYLQWGSDCLTRFNGMFALAIWDGERFFCAGIGWGKSPSFTGADRARSSLPLKSRPFPISSSYRRICSISLNSASTSTRCTAMSFRFGRVAS